MEARYHSKKLVQVSQCYEDNFENKSNYHNTLKSNEFTLH